MVTRRNKISSRPSSKASNSISTTLTSSSCKAVSPNSLFPFFVISSFVHLIGAQHACQHALQRDPRQGRRSGRHVLVRVRHSALTTLPSHYGCTAHVGLRSCRRGRV